MQQNLALTKGLYFSQSILLALTRAGMERKSAYEAVQRAAMKTWKGEGTFRRKRENTNRRSRRNFQRRKSTASVLSTFISNMSMRRLRPLAWNEIERRRLFCGIEHQFGYSAETIKFNGNIRIPRRFVRALLDRA